jgi:hypothetical protein
MLNIRPDDVTPITVIWRAGVAARAGAAVAAVAVAAVNGIIPNATSSRPLRLAMMILRLFTSQYPFSLLVAPPMIMSRRSAVFMLEGGVSHRTRPPTGRAVASAECRAARCVRPRSLTGSFPAIFPRRPATPHPPFRRRCDGRPQPLQAESRRSASTCSSETRCPERDENHEYERASPKHFDASRCSADAFASEAGRIRLHAGWLAAGLRSSR